MCESRPLIIGLRLRGIAANDELLHSGSGTRLEWWRPAGRPRVQRLVCAGMCDDDSGIRPSLIGSRFISGKRYWVAYYRAVGLVDHRRFSLPGGARTQTGAYSAATLKLGDGHAWP
jgi:hypothetical protein